MTLRSVLLVFGITCVLVACEDSKSDACANAVAPLVTVTGVDAVLPRDTTQTTATLTFDQAVTGVTSDTVQISGGNASIGAVVGGPETYTVEITGLEVTGSYALTITPGVTSSDCAQALETTQIDFEVEGWKLTEPFFAGAPRATQVPFFEEVTDTVEGFNDQNKGLGRATVVDFDGDGLDDIATLSVTDLPMRMRFYRNLGPTDDGTPRFEDITLRAGVADTEASILVFGDVDNDGDVDLFTGLSFRSIDGQLGIWFNDGSGIFTYKGPSGIADALIAEQNGTRIVKEMAAATFADFNGDGFLDLYIGLWNSGTPDGDGTFQPPPDELYQGDGTGQFTAVTLPEQHNPLSSEANPALETAARAAYGVATGDYDNDGDIDIFVNNYGAGRPALGSPPRYWEHNLLWRNDGDMSFVDVGKDAGVAATMRGIGGVQEETPVVLDGRTYPSPIGGNGFGCMFADFDNDADLDLVIGTIAHPDYTQSDRLLLHTNPGGPDPVFGEESAERGLEYYEDELHPVFVDVNNDGFQDLAVSRLRGGSKWEFYFQNTQGVFTRQNTLSTAVDIQRPGPTVWLDADGDGDLDFYMPKNTADFGGRLFLNKVGQVNNTLVIRLVATAPRDATGARVTLSSTAGTQIREITSGVGHYNSQSTRAAVFGLGGDNGAQNVTIRWPDGEEQVLGDVRANVELKVTQGGDVELVREL